MALGSHLITVRRFEKYIDDVIGKKANLPDTSKTIIGNISQINRVSDETYTNLINPTAQTETRNGVTLTNNGDGTYTVNGTAQQTTLFNIQVILDNFDALKNTKVVGCPIGGSWSTYILYVAYYNGSSLAKDYGETGNGKNISDIPSGVDRINITIIVYGGTTCNNLLFKPMITTKLDATYDDFIPYSGSGALNENVAEMYEDISQINSDLSDNTNKLNTLINTNHLDKLSCLVPGANLQFNSKLQVLEFFVQLESNVWLLIQFRATTISYLVSNDNRQTWTKYWEK